MTLNCSGYPRGSHLKAVSFQYNLAPRVKGRKNTMTHQEYVAVGKILAYLPEHATLRAEVLARLAKDHCDERRALIFYGDYYFCLLVDKLLEPGHWTNALATYRYLSTSPIHKATYRYLSTSPIHTAFKKTLMNAYLRRAQIRKEYQRYRDATPKWGKDLVVAPDLTQWRSGRALQ